MQTPVGYDKLRAAALMERYDLELMIVSSPLNVWYTTGLPTLHGAANPILEALSNKFPSFAVIRRDGGVKLLCWVGFMSVDEFCWADDSEAIFSKDMVDLSAALEDMGFTGGRVGVESDLPKYAADTLGGIGLEVCDGLLDTLRLVKSPEEIARLTRSMEITREVTEACLGILKEGLTDNELIQFARCEMLRLGAEDWNHFTIRFGDSDPEAPGTGRALQAGELVRLDLGAIYKGYASDLNKHAIIGQADDEAKGILERLARLQRWCAESIRPGVNMEALSDAAADWCDENLPDGAAYLMGHSIGLQVEDAHLFGTLGGPDMAFEENMVFEIEAWENYGDTQLGVEDLYVVTRDGCKKLSSMTPDIYEIGS
ncbi:MAG: Xaa-Pro peptidase family protein [Oscillospiraceae bacterium]|nr:Xaa-Pro peptidase family protein [Oscillospiraceae bacterium]MCL1951530.1 Xaa-Pro peptidase family protein [Oscillospiraceae bacterium]